MYIIGKEGYVGCYFDYTSGSGRMFTPTGNASSAYDCMELCYEPGFAFAAYDSFCKLSLSHIISIVSL